MNPRETLPAPFVSKERGLVTVGGLKDCTTHHGTAAFHSTCCDQAGPKPRQACSVEMRMVGSPCTPGGLVTVLPPQIMKCLSP